MQAFLQRCLHHYSEIISQPKHEIQRCLRIDIHVGPPDRCICVIQIVEKIVYETSHTEFSTADIEFMRKGQVGDEIPWKRKRLVLRIVGILFSHIFSVYGQCCSFQ